MAALGKRSLTLTVDGVDHTAEAVSVSINTKAAEGGTTTFANASAGGSRVYSAAMEFTQDLASTSLLHMLWNQLGAHVPIVIHPAGGATIDATHPSISGTVIVSENDGPMLGGAASTSAGDLFTTTVEWEFESKPVWNIA